MNKKAMFSLSLIVSLLGLLSLSVKIPNVYAPYVIITIEADGSISPTPSNITTLDNVTYTFTSDINAFLVIEKNDIVVDGTDYKIQGPGSGIGVDLSYRNNVTLQNIEVINFTFGIYINSSSYNTIASSNASSNNQDGIRIQRSSYNTITGNTASNIDSGIYLYNSSYNTITSNTATSNGDTGIFLGSSSNNTITGNTISNSTEGISLFDSSDNTITGNNLPTNLNAGIRLQSSSNNSIYENRIVKSGNAIRLHQSSQNTISRNNVTLCVYNGIMISESSYNTISENAVTNNPFQLGGSGIGLSLSFNNFLLENNVTANNYWGLWSASSNNNTIFENIIRNNSVGFDSSESNFNIVSANNIIDNRFSGIYLEASANNIIQHNNLINNTNQVVVEPGSTNSWDNGVEGNYWNNYTGVDLNHNGIGDSPHVIDANNTDNYPLMGMFHSFNTSVGEYVNVISNSTVTYFDYWETHGRIIIQVRNATTEQSFGFCRVSIPHNLIDPEITWISVFIDDGTVTPLYFNNTIYDNGTHRWIYVAYPHPYSLHEIVIVPEFPSFLILPLFMAATLLAALMFKENTIH